MINDSVFPLFFSYNRNKTLIKILKQTFHKTSENNELIFTHESKISIPKIEGVKTYKHYKSKLNKFEICHYSFNLYFINNLNESIYLFFLSFFKKLFAN